MSKLRTANLLGALALAVADRIEAGLKTHPNQNDSAAAALNVVGVYEGCSITTLSQLLKLSHPATVRLVAKLGEARLVEAREGTDKRASALFLTADGRARGKEILRDRCVALEEVVACLSPLQRDQLDGIASTILRALTVSAFDGGHICRLCDEEECPGDICPVHVRAMELLKT